MRLIVDGDLLGVQGAVERTRDIIENNECKVVLVEDSKASASYKFTDEKKGGIGSIKVSVLPNNKTEVYGYPPQPPDTKWLVEYLPRNMILSSLSESLVKLLNLYAWQIQQRVFNLSANDLFRSAYSENQIDFGWDKFGLTNVELQKEAFAELEKYRKIVHGMQLNEYKNIIDTIVTQLRSDGYSLVMFDGKTRVGINLTALNKGIVLDEPPLPPEPKIRGGKIDLWLDWYNAMLNTGHKCTLEIVAKKSGYSLGYIKQRHMIYKAKPYLTKSNQNT